MMRFLASVAFAALFAVATAVAQVSESEAGLVALRQACLDAGNDVVVLNVAAHPDDESSRTNAMLRRKFGMRIVTAYSTYGDGGQNAIGREIGPELADLRVRETMRAAAMSGVEVRWLGMPDFGFSKTLEETLSVWGAERLRDRMREVVDLVDPDVIITNHTLTQGHGHHRASFWAVREILKERAAKGAFVPRLYSRCAMAKTQLTFDPSELDGARGETFARLAYRAWTQHVTQGPWGPHDPLQVGKDYWQVAYPEAFDAVVAGDLGTWGREAGGGAWSGVDPATLAPGQLASEARTRLAAVNKRLADVLAQGEAAPAARMARVLRRQAESLQRVLLALANVRVEVWLDRDTVARGSAGKLLVIVHGYERVQNLVVRSGDTMAEPIAAAVRATPFDGMATAPSADNAAGVSEPKVPPVSKEATPENAPVVPAGRYSVEFRCGAEADGARGEGPEPEFVTATITFEFDGVSFALSPTLPYTAVPPMVMTWDREVMLVPKGHKVDVMLSASVRANRDSSVNTAVRLSMGPGIQATSLPGRLTLTPEHDEARILVHTTVDASELAPDASLEIGYRDTAARLPVRIIDVDVPGGMRIALVRGPDDSTERALADLGVPFVALDHDALLATELETFTAVLLDIRAYHHRAELAEVRDRLLQYCRAGGRIVAMYHKPGEWNERAGHPALAPFPLTIGNDRVTEEKAAVTFLQPQHRLMTYPHALSDGDFTGWVQERGLNFPKSWDPAWAPLLSMKDAGDEKPLEGALLYTQYGRGDFVYCSLALYRQLRAGNQGAARLLVNLLAR